MGFLIHWSLFNLSATVVGNVMFRIQVLLLKNSLSSFGYCTFQHLTGDVSRCLRSPLCSSHSSSCLTFQVSAPRPEQQMELCRVFLSFVLHTVT